MSKSPTLGQRRPLPTYNPTTATAFGATHPQWEIIYAGPLVLYIGGNPRGVQEGNVQRQELIYIPLLVSNVILNR